MQRDLAQLEARIGYQFHTRSILREAMTHSSYANELRARSKREVQCNERLEFLGDAVLASIVSEYLFREYPGLPEGELTQRRKAVVQSSALASYAREIELGAYLLLGNGEEKVGGRERQSTLENAFEALLAAIFLDAKSADGDGMETVRNFLLPFVKKELEENYSPIITDPKTELQQLVQQAEGDVLTYHVVGESGPDHDKVFEVEARMNSNVIGCGKGKSKREAEQNAAIEALRLFGEIE
ncbi:MAG: ribonuclease III [Clostridia bacterium]|nr:ribonuclease III [Clostridia bacterium]